MDIKEFLLKKLFFPRVITLDRPGIIISKTLSRSGSEMYRRRNVWHFESIAARLQMDLAERIGKENASSVWYRIGKDGTTRYLLLADARPPPKLLVPAFVKYVFQLFYTSGMGFCRDMHFSNKTSVLKLKGYDNIVCRKSQLPSYFAGVASGVMSFLLKKNIEADARCGSCPGECVIIANPSIPTRHIPDFKALKPLPDYNRLNFPVEMESQGAYSFTDMQRFRKILRKSTFEFFGHPIYITEAGLVEMVAGHYEQQGQMELFRNAVKEESRDILLSIDPSMKTIKNIITSFGLGIPVFRTGKGIATVTLKHPPITKYGFEYTSTMIRGFLEAALERKLAPAAVSISHSQARFSFQ